MDKIIESYLASTSILSLIFSCLVVFGVKVRKFVVAWIASALILALVIIALVTAAYAITSLIKLLPELPMNLDANILAYAIIIISHGLLAIFIWRNFDRYLD